MLKCGLENSGVNGRSILKPRMHSYYPSCHMFLTRYCLANGTAFVVCEMLFLGLEHNEHVHKYSNL